MKRSLGTRKGRGMNRQLVGLEKGKPILRLLVVLSLLVGYLFTESIQVQSHYNLGNDHPNETQFVDMPKLEIVSESVKRIRKVIINIMSVFLLDEETNSACLANFQNADCHRKSYLSKALLMAYIHDVDGKKRNPLVKSASYLSMYKLEIL